MNIVVLLSLAINHRPYIYILVPMLAFFINAIMLIYVAFGVLLHICD